MSPRSRRALLCLASASAFGLLGGCSSSPSSTPSATPTDGEEPTPTRTPAGTPDATATRTPTEERSPSVPTEEVEASAAEGCGAEYESFEPWYVASGPGPLGGFTLAFEREEIAPGETLVAHVRNATDEERRSGNQMKYDLQYEGESGWRTVFALEERVPWTDDAVPHAPGEGFTYDLEFTRSGVVIDVPSQPDFHVCHPLEPGTYRFVYWGISTEKGQRFGRDYALSRTFSVV